MLSYDEKDRPYSIDGNKFQMLNHRKPSAEHTYHQSQGQENTAAKILPNTFHHKPKATRTWRKEQHISISRMPYIFFEPPAAGHIRGETPRAPIPSGVLFVTCWSRGTSAGAWPLSALVVHSRLFPRRRRGKINSTSSTKNHKHTAHSAHYKHIVLLFTYIL